MSLVLGIVDYVVIGIMLLISASVGLYFRFTGGRQKTTDEFLMGDKRMGILPVSFSIMATSFSAVTILGEPSETYLYGMQRVMVNIGFPIGLLLASYLIVPVYFDAEVYTMYQYLGKRFGKIIELVTSLLYSIQMMLYLPVVLHGPSLALSFVTDISVWTSVLAMGLICTFYSAMGGLKAVLWTDVFQSLLMLFTNFALIVKGSIDSGGTKEVFRAANEGQRLEIFDTRTDLTVRYTIWNTLVEGLIFGLFINGTTFQQVLRLLSAGTVEKAQRSLHWTVMLSTLFRTSGCFLGIIIYAFYRHCNPLKDPNMKLKSPDQLVPLFILAMFGHIPGLSGVCIAGIFSASLSTMSSILTALVTLTLEDYIKPLLKDRNLKDSTMALVARSLALFYGGLCLFLTLVMASAKGILEAGTVIVSIASGPTLGMFCLGMFTVRANEMGTLIGLITGVAFQAWIGFGSVYYAPRYPSLPLNITGCLDNATQYNSSFMVDFESGNFSFVDSIKSEAEERYISPFYKVSFNWFSFFGSFITFVVGYTASFAIGLYKKPKRVDAKHLSPVVRKWLTNGNPSGTKYIEVLQETKEMNIQNDENDLQL